MKDLLRLLVAVTGAWFAAGIALLFIEYVGMWAVMRYAPDPDPFFILKSAVGQLAAALLFAGLLGLFYKFIAGSKAVVWPIWIVSAALVVVSRTGCGTSTSRPSKSCATAMAPGPHQWDCRTCLGRWPSLPLSSR